MEGRIIELQFDQGIAQGFKIGRIDGINPGKNNRRDQSKSGQRLFGGIFLKGDRIADFDIGSVFDIGDHIADFAGTQNVDRACSLE